MGVYLHGKEGRINDGRQEAKEFIDELLFSDAKAEPDALFQKIQSFVRCGDTDELYGFAETLQLWVELTEKKEEVRS